MECRRFSPPPVTGNTASAQRSSVRRPGRSGCHDGEERPCPRTYCGTRPGVTVPARREGRRAGLAWSLLPQGRRACQTGPVPGPDSQDQQPADHIDAEFAKIVAGFDAAPKWPSESTAEETSAAADDKERPKPAGPMWPASGPVLNEPSLLDALDTFGTQLPDGPEDRYVPPPPPPLPRIPVAAILAVLAIVFGFVLFMDRDLLPVSAGVSMLLALVFVLGGAAALIMRLRPGGADDDPPPDDGAVV